MTRLEYLRRQKGLSQTKFALLIGMNSTNVSLVERGHRKAWPNLVEKIAEVLEVKKEDIFDKEGNPIELVIADE
jgi:putative transcriptional regulator